MPARSCSRYRIAHEGQTCPLAYHRRWNPAVSCVATRTDLRIARARNLAAHARRPRINERALVIASVSGQIAHPIGRANPYRIGYDGVPRVLPGTGGITLNHRIGDPCVGLAGDHIEPGV